MTQGQTVLDPRAAGGKRLQGKTAVVTGSGQGHGRATARRFVEEGASVMIVDRHQPGAERVRDELRAYGGQAETFIGDISSHEVATSLMEAARERFGRIDILVNNVGGAFRLPGSGEMGWEKTPEDLVGNIQNNLFTCLWCCWAVAPIMIEQQSGSIVNFGSHAVRGMGRLGYAAAKGGILGNYDQPGPGTCTLQRADQPGGAPFEYARGRRHPRHTDTGGNTTGRRERAYAGGLREPHADPAKPPRHAGGSGGGRDISRLGRFVVHHGRVNLRGRRSVLPLVGRAGYQPHISRAVSTTNSILRHCCSSVRRLPAAVDANPHCGLNAR